MPGWSLKLILVHACAWMIYILLYATIWRDAGIGFQTSLLFNLSLLPVKIILVYVCLLVLVPAFLVKKKYWQFGVGLVVLTFSGALLNQFYIQSILHITPSGEQFWNIETLSKRFTFLNSPLLVALTFEGIKLNEQLSREKLSAELALLKNQLQPHFFFNTLNNLYSLVLQKSDLAPDLILKLSSLMRYIVDDSNKERVSLTEEVNFVVNYIAIEKIRYGKKVNVEMDIPSSLPPYQLPPMLFFTLIENAFKHGVANEIDTAWIKVSLKIQNKSVAFTVINSIPVFRQANQIETRQGIGIRNTEQRLQLIYGSGYEFRYARTANAFEGHLVIPV